MAIKAVLFDWDGTLVDSLHLKIQNAGRLFQQRFGVPAQMVKDAYRRHSGISRRKLFDAICADNGLPLLSEAMFADLSDQFTVLNRQSAARVQVFPDVVDTLVALRNAGVWLVVSSSAAPDELVGVAKQVGLQLFFDEILGSQGDFTKGLAHVQYISQKHGLQPANILFVGDEPADVRLAQASGVVCVAKIGSHSREALAVLAPDHLVTSIAELLPIVFSSDRFGTWGSSSQREDE